MRTELKIKLKLIVVCVSIVTISSLSIPTLGQLIDKTRALNTAGDAVANSLARKGREGQTATAAPNHEYGTAPETAPGVRVKVMP